VRWFDSGRGHVEKDAAPGADKSEIPGRQTFDVTVGSQGRLVVPAPLRRRLGIEPGDVLVARAQDNCLVLERRDAILTRLRRRVTIASGDVSVVDALIEERRAEAERESRA
jgi:AbrB family looped-hinge helix DNA binding protein